MIQPPKLKLGDTIGIVSTARKISFSEIETAIRKFEAWGLKVKLGSNLFQQYHQFAGTDQQRADDFQSMLNDPSVKAIICARGGYGTVRIIDDIDFSPLVANPKWIVGYSDVTVLHSHIHQLGIETIHGIMPININEENIDSQTVESLHQALFLGKIKYEFLGKVINFVENISAPIVGGNLSILYSLIGSKSDVNTDGKVLFIEDLDEYLYHIDRMMMNLFRNGKFDKPAAILVGGLSDMNDNSVPFGFSASEIVERFMISTNIPAFFNFPAGHISDNRSFILGRNCHLSFDGDKIFFEQ